MKNIAIIVAGGLGDQDSGIHIPTLYNLVLRLSRSFAITVYSHSLPGKSPSVTSCGAAQVRFLPITQTDPPLKRAAVFIGAIVHDHLEKRFTLIHAFGGVPFGLYAIILGNILGIPSAVTLQGGETANLPEVNYGLLSGWFSRFLVRFVCRRADVLLVQSQSQAKELKALGCDREKIFCVFHGVDTQRFKPKSNGDCEPPYHFLWVGDLSPVKDPFSVLRAFALIAQKIDSRLRMIGEDHFGGRLQAFSSELGISNRVEFLGFVTHSEIPQHLAWAHVLLHSSLHEGGSAVVAEAAAMAVPTCGTRVGIMADVAGNVTEVAPLGDYRQLAHNALELVRNTELYLARQRNGISWASSHDSDWSAREIATVYRTMLSNSMERAFRPQTSPDIERDIPAT